MANAFACFAKLLAMSASVAVAVSTTMGDGLEVFVVLDLGQHLLAAHARHVETQRYQVGPGVGYTLKTAGLTQP